MTIFEAYNDCKKKLQTAGIEDYVFEAKMIIKHVTGYTNAQILTKYTQELTQFQQNNITAIIKQRLIRYPLQYIIGKWQFFDMDLFVGEGVLVPRQDTETVCESAFEVISKMENPKVVDLCSGSGCIALAVKKYCPHSDVTAVEKSGEAYKYLVKKAQ